MNSGEPRPTQEMYQHGLTVPRTDPNQHEEDNSQTGAATATSDNSDSLSNNIKDGVKTVADKVSKKL